MRKKNILDLSIGNGNHLSKFAQLKINSYRFKTEFGLHGSNIIGLDDSGSDINACYRKWYKLKSSKNDILSQWSKKCNLFLYQFNSQNDILAGINKFYKETKLFLSWNRSPNYLKHLEIKAKDNTV